VEILALTSGVIREDVSFRRSRSNLGRLKSVLAEGANCFGVTEQFHPQPGQGRLLAFGWCR
jgi:hypothetical protein